MKSEGWNVNASEARDLLIAQLDACLERMTKPNAWALLLDLQIDLEQRIAGMRDTEEPRAE
jgi:hypothetical protein